jgi:hypothetical protein
MTHLERLREYIRFTGRPGKYGHYVLIGKNSSLQISASNHVYFTEDIARFWDYVILREQTALEWLEFFGLNTETVNA